MKILRDFLSRVGNFNFLTKNRLPEWYANEDAPKGLKVTGGERRRCQIKFRKKKIMPIKIKN